MPDIFNINSEEAFLHHSLEAFHYQYENIEVYRRFVDLLNINPAEVRQLQDIPFLPIELFKSQKIIDKTGGAQLYFQSSGTTQSTLSTHWVADEELYRESIARSFKTFIGKPEEFVFLGLLPSYLEKQHSSLIYMVDFLMQRSARPENGYYLYNHEDLRAVITRLSKEKQKTILFGVSFALLDFLDAVPGQSLHLPPEITVIETGGMKGRKVEMTKDDLLAILQKGFHTERIYSEYSMTELLSQAYSLGHNIYESPAWMRILVRNTEDPRSQMPDGRVGAVNIIDLANRHSCSFIATQDLGRVVLENGRRKFQILGRMDNSDIRGCSLLVS